MSNAAGAFVQFSLPVAVVVPASRPVVSASRRHAAGRLAPQPPDPTRPELTQLRALNPQLSSAAELQHARERARRGAMPTMIPPLDRLLGGGLQRGKLVEIFARRSTGRFSIVLGALAAATSCGESAALVDHGDHLDPRAAEAAGVDLARLLWVRPQTLKEALAASEMAIAAGFPLVVVDLGIRVHRGPKRIDDSVWIRLARAAAAHGAALLISAPFHISGTSGEAVVASRTARAQWSGTGRSPRLLAGLVTHFTLERHRHVRVGGREEVRMRARPEV